MNKLYRNVLVIASILALIALTSAYFMRKKSTQLSPQTKTEFSNQGLQIKTVYCQPFKKGRLIFGDSVEGALQPYGQYWRLGANEATTLETSQDIIISNHRLSKGVYSVYAVPGEETWTIGFNEVANRWGASEPDYSKDLFLVEVPVNYTKESKEQFTILINEKTITFWWDTSKIIVSYKVAK